MEETNCGKHKAKGSRTTEHQESSGGCEEGTDHCSSAEIYSDSLGKAGGESDEAEKTQGRLERALASLG